MSDQDTEDKDIVLGCLASLSDDEIDFIETLLTQDPERFRRAFVAAREEWDESNPGRYDPQFGDDKVCQCAHPYYRHFDTYDNMRAIGCKYCQCYEFVAPVIQAKNRP